MAPTLEKVFDLRAFLGKTDTLPLGHVKGGAQRIIVPVTSGFLKGSGVEAEIIPTTGADWLLLDPATGTAHLDVRIALRTKDGDSIYIYYPGIIKLDEKIGMALSWDPAMRTTKSSDHYFFTTPRIEVSNEKHKWMEQTVFVAHGHFFAEGDGTQAVEYEVYKLVSG
ncbi:hypothetical protein LTR95_016987 [Oleoguttula sp. CCFEE 5521]